MVKIQCELCGSNDMVKEDGVFVCKYCGCKYSLEEARKMMIEGPVDVSGSTVKIDISNELKGRFTLALDEYNDYKYDEVDATIEEIIKIDSLISDVWYLKSLIYRQKYQDKSKSYYERAVGPSTHSIGIIDEEKYKEMYGHVLVIDTKRAVLSKFLTYCLWLDGVLILENFPIGYKYGHFVPDGPHKLHISCFKDGSGGTSLQFEMKEGLVIHAKYGGLSTWKYE